MHTLTILLAQYTTHPSTCNSMSKPPQKYTRLEKTRNRKVHSLLAHGDLWKLAKRGLLHKYFKEADDYLEEFYRHVELVISKKDYENNSKEIIGRWLCFDPTMTMYDGLAEEFSKGFFDSDSVPPPELWVARERDTLICFIPEQFIANAHAGIVDQMSGCLEWAE